MLRVFAVLVLGFTSSLAFATGKGPNVGTVTATSSLKAVNGTCVRFSVPIGSRLVSGRVGIGVQTTANPKFSVNPTPGVTLTELGVKGNDIRYKAQLSGAMGGIRIGTLEQNGSPEKGFIQLTDSSKFGPPHVVPVEK